MIPDQLIILMLVAITCGIGLARLLRERKLLSKKSTFTQDYIEHLTTYIGSFGNHYESYNWLVHRMDKMQNQMGADGICALYQPPHTPTQYLNYAIILNTLPNLRNALRESNNSNIYHHSNSLIDALIRHQGTLHDLGELNNKSLRNPVIWLREGVRAITASPLTLLGWLGVLSEATVSRLASGRLFLGISAFGGLVAFISAVMRIVLGWEAFTQKVSAWWPW